MAATRQQIETNLAQLETQLATVEAQLASVASRLIGSVALSKIERENLVNRQQQLTNTAEVLVNEIGVARSALQQADAPGVVPQPPRTAGQTVNDDSLPNPLKRPPLEVDNVTGRINPFPVFTSGSNAVTTKTLANDDGDFGTDGATVSLNVTQSTFTPAAVGYLAPTGPSTAPGGVTITPVIDVKNLGGVTGVTAQPLGGAQSPAVPITVARDDLAPVSAANTTVTINNSYNNAQQVIPQPNLLDNFASVTYSASVYLLTPEQYNSYISSKRRSVANYTLLFQSAGAPVDSNDNVISFRSPFFSDDFYIDSITVENLLPGKQTRAAHMVSEIKFTVVEPNGISMLDRLYGAVQEVIPKNGGGGNINYAAAPYMMVLRWYGWDINGQLIRGAGASLSDPNAVVEKFIPFMIERINWGVSNKLTTYDWVCRPMGQIASGTSRGTIPYDIELSDQTVRGLLTGELQTVEAAAISTPPTSGNTSTTPAPAKANTAASAKTVIKQGLLAAMNEFQKKLVNDGIYEVADQYELVFANGAEDIADAVVTLPGAIKNISVTPMAQPTTKDAASADPKRTSVDNTVRKLSITAGQQIVQVIDQAIRNSSYIYRQARVTNSEETGSESAEDAESPLNPAVTQNIRWFEISMEIQQLAYDYKRNDFAVKVKYIISPYVVPNFDSKYFPLPKFNGLHKKYKYWFTGENTSVLDYSVTFNHLYALTVSGSNQNNNATQLLRRKYTASLREVPKYTYQSRSSENSAGAEGKGNEISANAAEYLYSPTDLAEIKLRIVGDPAWIQQGSLAGGIDAKAFNYTGFLPDGTINFDASQVLFSIEWQRPRDYNLNTGLADPYETINGEREPIQSYIYMAKKCISEFRQGKFEQIIEGTLYNFPVANTTAVTSSQASTAGAGTTNSVALGSNATDGVGGGINAAELGGLDPATGGLGIRVSDISNQGLVVPSGVGTLPITRTSDIVNLQTLGEPPGTPDSDTLSRQQVRGVDSNGENISVAGITAPPILNSQQITQQSTQQISIST